MKNNSNTNEPPPDWPPADGFALELSRQLSARIRREIEMCGGDIGFDRYMEMALYEPGLGYYSAGARKFGKDGDFTTAPEVSPLFSICVARQCEQLFAATGSAEILELGAGSGVMAADILEELRGRDALPDRYLILERSAELRQRQQQLLHQRHPDLQQRLVWLDRLPEHPFNGLVLANEVLDALPVQRLGIVRGEVYELRVALDADGFCWRRSELPMTDNGKSPLAPDLVRQLPDGYRSEYAAMLPPFIGSLAHSLGRGVILLFDYGYSHAEYYHPQRVDGTLTCYYRHRRHANPFIHVGIQDITASVDFTRVAESAHAHGLTISAYTNQAGFLIGCGLERIISSLADGDEQRGLRLRQQAGKLLLPGEMGENFKVMALTAACDPDLPAFEYASQLHRL